MPTRHISSKTARFRELTLPSSSDTGRVISIAESNVTARKLFKQKLPGTSNVRSSAKHMYVARRVAASNGWESFGPISPAAYPTIFWRADSSGWEPTSVSFPPIKTLETWKPER